MRVGEAILPKWWRTIDRGSLSCILILFSIGILLGLAASPPLAAKNGFEAFHYVKRQAVFGVIIEVTTIASKASPPNTA